MTKPTPKPKAGAKPGNQNAKKENPRVYLSAMVDPITRAKIDQVKNATGQSIGDVIDAALAVLIPTLPPH